MPRPKQRTPELRERVLESAVEQLGRDGVSGLTTRRVAKVAGTSPPAIYELFGDKLGLVRAIIVRGFRSLHRALEATPKTDDPLADTLALARAFRRFARDHPALVEVMFARPFADFAPDREELEAAIGANKATIQRVQRCIDARLIDGDPTDIAHALMALSQGLASAERARRLASTEASCERRWDFAIEALLRGLRP